MDRIDHSSGSTEQSEGDVESKLKEKLNKIGLMTDEQYENLEKKDKVLLIEVYNVITARQINRAKYIKAFKDQAITKSAVAAQI